MLQKRSSIWNYKKYLYAVVAVAFLMVILWKLTKPGKSSPVQLTKADIPSPVQLTKPGISSPVQLPKPGIPSRVKLTKPGIPPRVKLAKRGKSFPEIPKSDPFCDNLPTGYKEIKEWVYDDTRALPSKEDICYSNQQQLASLFHRYFDTIQISCLSLARAGPKNAYGKEICQNKTLIPANSCLVYSFGINFEFSFDDYMSQRLGCEVHSFDPSMGIGSYKRSELIHFHDIGLADFDGKTVGASWKMNKLETIRKELNHNERNIDVLKLDIEEWEWVVLPDILKSTAIINKHIKQIIIEFHLRGLQVAKTKFFWIYKLFALKDLYDANFRVFWIYRGICFNVKCYEVSFLRI